MADRLADRETIARAGDHRALRVWLRLLTCTQLIERRVRARLRERFATTLPRFDLMAQLERHPEGLKMSALSRRLMVTGGNVTAIVDQLEKEGLVERLAEPADRRAFCIRLTRAGDKSFAEMARAHEEWVGRAPRRPEPARAGRAPQAPRQGEAARSGGAKP